MVIVLPLPPRELSPNARPHYMAKARAVKRYRETAYLSSLAVRLVRPMQAAKVTARFFFRTCRHRDRDNLLASLKPAFDGIADARVVGNDAGMIHMPVEQYVDRADPRVEIVVEAVP
ncbi:MAG: endodeoxyribonuclease RusA [Planctomycetes bacterium]|nr:endodeoxyribonuclease RusA [Planctomycetota bacterium]